MPDANDHDTLNTVRAALHALTGADDAPLLLAVSGGPDSMAMLDLVRRCWRGPVSAATIDHGLRAQSGEEAAMVAAWCTAAAIAHTVLHPATPIEGSLQAAARAVRYRLLAGEAERSGAAFIVTAHHADDQLETLLMRLARGSGVDGLAGIRARNGQVIRPLLALRKAQLERHCQAHKVPFVDDPSNRNSDFDRVRMRAALAGFDLIDPLLAVRSAGALAQAAEALDWIVEREASAAISVTPEGVALAAGGYPPALCRRLVLRSLEQVQPGLAPRGDALDRVIAQLQAGAQAMIGNVLCRGGDSWRFATAPQRRAWPADMPDGKDATDNS